MGEKRNEIMNEKKDNEGWERLMRLAILITN